VVVTVVWIAKATDFAALVRCVVIVIVDRVKKAEYLLLVCVVSPSDFMHCTITQLASTASSSFTVCPGEYVNCVAVK
jgi:hypothetical protein